MTKRELWKMFDRYPDGGIDKQDLMDAVEAYSSASNGAKPIVSGRSEQLIFDCPEPQWHNGDIQRYGQCTFCNNKAFIKN